MHGAHLSWEQYQPSSAPSIEFGAFSLRLSGDRDSREVLIGADPLEILETYIDRTVDLHIKDIRPRVVDAARAGSMSFEFAIVEGVFTVPGDGGIDYTEVFALLKKHGYEGWLLVEAEQNPLTADPFLYAKLAREYIREVAGW